MGDSERNKLIAIRRVSFVRQLKSKLKFKKPEPGKYSFLVYLISDCWVGCDQQSEPLPLEIEPESEDHN